MSKPISFIKQYKEPIVFAGVLAGYCLVAYCLQMPCPIKFVTGISCPGCGVTRSVLSLCTLDFGAALTYHPLVFYLLLLIPSWFVLHRRGMAKTKKVVFVVSIALFIAVYICRLWIVPSPVLECAPENGFWMRLFQGALSFV